MMKNYFNGIDLYGDDFNVEQIEEWYKEEAEAFANLYGLDITEHTYPYHYLNIIYGFKYLKKVDKFNAVLGFGASWGYELLPIIDKVDTVSIVEASEQTRSLKLGNSKPLYITPTVSGSLDLRDNSFDLITCFDTLHHIPNVTFVLNELFRVLKPGGYLLLREPIHSMGDWRYERVGVTKNERGISVNYLDNIIKEANIQILHKHYFGFMISFLNRLLKNPSFFRTKFYFHIDKLFSKLFAFNVHYHETNKLQRIAPINIFYVLKK